MTRGRNRGLTRRPSRVKPKASADPPLDEGEAIRHVEGPAALNEVRTFAAQNRRQAARANRQARLQALANFGPIFTTPGFQFGVWRYPQPGSSGIHILPYCQLSNEALAFIQAAYNVNWVTKCDWIAWRQTPEARKLIDNPERVATATPAQLSKLLTLYIRGDRFNEGFLNSGFEAGTLTAIVLRAEALLRRIGKENDSSQSK